MSKEVKADKAVIIKAIIKGINLGKDRGKLLATVGKQWHLSQRTFDRLWKTANEQFKELHNKAKKAADDTYIQLSAEAAKEAVMSKAERLQTLSNIARGEIPLRKAMVVNGKIEFIDVVPDYMDRKNAIAELNKMEGDYAPNKIQHSGTIVSQFMSIDPLENV